MAIKLQQPRDIAVKRGKIPGRNERVETLRLSSLIPDANQVREHLTEIDGLSKSIKAKGVINPIVVREVNGKAEKFEIVAGHRRYFASKKAGLGTIPCLVRNISDNEKLQIQITENLQREDLDPLEEARGYERLIKKLGMNQSDVAKQLGKRKEYISQMMGILKLPDSFLEKVATSQQLSKAVLLELSRVKNKKKQEEMFGRALKGNLTVSDARRSRGQKAKKATLTSLSKRFSDDLGSVTLTFNKRPVTKKDELKLLANITKQIKNS